MIKTSLCLVFFQLSLLTFPIAQAQQPDKPVSGVYFAEKMEISPRLNAKGMAWWKGRLIIANREPSKLYSYTPRP